MSRQFLGLLLLILVRPAGLSASSDWMVRCVSSPPQMVSGPQALIEIRVPPAASPDALQVRLNGRPLETAFRPGREKGSLMGLVDGLNPGSNLLEIFNGEQPVARLELTSHPPTGPIFSGPHQTPFICQTEAAGLGAPRDPDCGAQTSVAYFYKTSRPSEQPSDPGVPPGWRIPPEFKPYDPKGPRPSDLMTTTTSEGHTVDYIVRRETGTVNRAIYVIAFLHEPGRPLPDPWTKTEGWNGRLVYAFGGGCRAGYRQSLPMNILNDTFLSRGYAAASSSLNVFGNDCNDLVSGETLMMVKEYFSERFGPPVHTIGWGGSGGSIQQHLAAQNYPGLLDGIIPSVSYPDIVTTIPFVVDCSLLARAMEGSEPIWTAEQKKAVSGFATWETCRRWMANFSPAWLRPSHCHEALPAGMAYDAASNPQGVRCTIYDNQVNAFGRDPETGRARRPLDNVGVQYGLAAFNSSLISAEQFLDLNERVGGYDADGNLVPERSQADAEALRLAYSKGRVVSGAGGLSSTPIIDIRAYLDPVADIHDRVRSLSMRARLVAANGQAENQVIWTFPRAGRGEEAPAPGARLNDGMELALQLMDRWLDRIQADTSSADRVQKVARNRPPELADACWTREGERIDEPQSLDGAGRCNRLYPNHADPRQVAGAPPAGDILKCALKPVDEGDYQQPLSAPQLERLKRIFPQGVCDYSRPGIGRQPLEGTWLSY